MTEKELGRILATMYNNAPHNEQTMMIRIFGIKYGGIIQLNKYSIANIVEESGIKASYVTEVYKGIRLGKYVMIKPEMDTF